MLMKDEIIKEMALHIADSAKGNCILCKNPMKSITLCGMDGCDGNCMHDKLTEEEKAKIITSWFIWELENK